MPTALATTPAFELDTDAAVQRLMRFLAVNSITGHEDAIGKELAIALKEVGVPAKDITFDDAHTRIPEPTPIGNLIAKLPGTGKKNAKPILFMTHMDTVPLCAGAKPRLRGSASSTNSKAKRLSAATTGRGARCWSRSRPNFSSGTSRTHPSRSCSPCAKRADCSAPNT